MVRTREFDPDAAMSKIIDLFAARGYTDTSMEDIVQATGVSRYGLYGTFGNKRELFEQALDRYAEQMGRRSFLKLLEPGASLADIRRIFDDRIDYMSAEDGLKSCLFIHSTMELAPGDGDLKDVLQKFMGRIAKVFSIGLRAAQERGEVRRDLDVRAVGDQLTGLMFGLAVLARAGYRRESLAAMVDSTLKALQPSVPT
jgi:TetR/AcrR family transcriptional regulator, transcriptional repressor for nem operon